MNNIDTTPLIHESSKYKLLNVKINGIVLRSQDILDIQINYEELAKGRLSFVDTMNIIEFGPLTYSLIQIEIVDILDSSVTIDAIATNVKTLRLKNNQINIEVYFEDVSCNALSTTFVSKSFKGMTMIQILDKIFTDNDLKAILIPSDDDFVYDYFVTPSNISLLEFIRAQSKISNFVMFSDKNGLNIVSKDILDYGSLNLPHEHDFTLNFRKDYPHWNILEYEGEISRVKNTQKIVKSNVSNTTVQDLKYSPTVLEVSDIYKTQKMNGGVGFKDLTIPDLVTNVGTKEISHVFHNEISGDDEDYRDIINNQQNITIVVQGLNTLRMYSKIKLILPRAASIQTQEGDETFSAYYVVTEVADKILAGNFLQFLTLKASDYGKGNSKI